MSSPTNWSGKLVRKYGPSIINPNPSEGTLAELIPFVEKEYRPGEGYFVDVMLQNEQGVTRSVDHTINTLNSAIDSVEKQANLEGSEISARGQISYGMIAKLESGIYGGGIESKVSSLMQTGENHLEADLLYGPGTTGLASLGTVNSIISGGAGATVILTITQATWAGGLWPQFIGAEFDSFDAGGTQSNATTALKLIACPSQTQCRLTFTKTAGDTIAVGDQIFFRGARAKSCVGFQGIAENNGSLFGIDAGVYPQWKAVRYAVGGPMSFDKVIEGCAALADNGLRDGLTLLVNNRSWADLMNDEAALRRYAKGAERKAAPGFDELEFTTNVGALRIRSHQFMKQGLSLGIPTQKCQRIGSTDLTFSLPGSKKNEFFESEIPDKTGKELRLYSDQGVLCEVPWNMIEFTGVVNAGDASPS